MHSTPDQDTSRLDLIETHSVPSMRDSRTVSTISPEELWEIQKRLDIQRAIKKREHTETCPQCEKSFKPTRIWQRFCSVKCSSRFHSEEITRRFENLERTRLALEEEADRLHKENKALRQELAALKDK